MTGNELLKQALALMAETDVEDYRELALPYINLMLAELFDANNRMLRHAGQPELSEIPTLPSLEAQLPYMERLQRLAMPYGLVSRLYFDEEDNPRLSMFNEEYANRVNECDKFLVCFGGE